MCNFSYGARTKLHGVGPIGSLNTVLSVGCSTFWTIRKWSVWISNKTKIIQLNNLDNRVEYMCLNLINKLAWTAFYATMFGMKICMYNSKHVPTTYLLYTLHTYLGILCGFLLKYFSRQTQCRAVLESRCLKYISGIIEIIYCPWYIYT